MPSYSPSESPTCLLLGLSPNSYKDFRRREENRFDHFSQQLQAEIDDQENEADRFDEEEEDPWQCSEDEDFDYGSNEDEEKGDEDEERWDEKIKRVSEEDLIFQYDPLNSPVKQNRCSHRNAVKARKNNSARSSYSLVDLPFWYRNESIDHLAVIVRQYARRVLKEEVNPCSKHDPRRLPHFIGRIQRTPIKAGIKEFHTLDKVDVYQRDIRQCGSNATRLSTHYFVSSWNDDGIPSILETVETDQLSPWRRKIIKRYPVSFIYCTPVFQSRTDFKYSVECDEHEVGYACQPWNYTAYLPPELLKKPECCDEIL